MNGYCVLCEEWSMLVGNKMCKHCYDKVRRLEIKNRELLTIDMDTIKQLRREGKYDEANDLIAAFHKTRDTVKRDILYSIKMRHKKILGHFMDSCVSCGNKLKMAGNGKYCQNCQDVRLKDLRAYRLKNKLCTVCGKNESVKNRLSCQKCLDKANNYHKKIKEENGKKL